MSRVAARSFGLPAVRLIVLAITARTEARRREAARDGANRQRLPAGEAAVDLVPVEHFGLAQAPAEKDSAAVHLAGKIDEPFDRALGLDAQLAQLLDVFLQPPGVAFQLTLHVRELVGIGIAGL